jgi:hypothetical protein
MSQVADQRSPMLRPISELLAGKQYYLLARKIYSEQQMGQRLGSNSFAQSWVQKRKPVFIVGK